MIVIIIKDLFYNYVLREFFLYNFQTPFTFYLTIIYIHIMFLLLFNQFIKLSSIIVYETSLKYQHFIDFFLKLNFIVI